MRLLKKIVAALVFVPLAALAQEAVYPSKPIRLVVPYSPGGGTDLMARIIANELTKSLGQPVVVENKAGAGGVIGTDAVVKAAADGYTLGLISSGHVINPWLYKRLPFDPLKDITPVMQIAAGPNVVVVHHAVPASTLKELVGLFRKEPERHGFGSAGIGNPTHLMGEVFQRATQTRLIHVPYKGSGQAEIGLAGGESTMIIDSIPAALPFIVSGKTRALAVTGSKRFPLLPDVPTTAEAGIAGLDANTWWGIIAPPGMPSPLVKRLHAAVSNVLRNPEIHGKFLQFGAEVSTRGDKEFARFMQRELEQHGELIRSLGIQSVD